MTFHLNKKNYGKSVYPDTGKTVEQETRGGLMAVSVGLVAIVSVVVAIVYFLLDYLLF